MIPCPIMPQFHFFFYIPLIILEFDLFILGYRIMNCIYRIIDTLIHCLDSSGHKYLTLQLLCIVFADQRLQFFDQSVGLFLRNEFRGLNRIYQKLQFRKFKCPAYHMIMITIPDRLSLYLNPKNTQIT